MRRISGVSSHAEFYPLLDDDALQSLAADIRENGLLDPITVTEDGVLLDGRNRLRACEIAGVEPITVIFDGDDIGAFVRSKNVRRHQPVGSLAMSTAMSMVEDGLRGTNEETGSRYWKRGSLISGSGDNASVWSQRIAEAGTVLDWMPELGPRVVAGEVALDAAYKEAKDARDRVDAEKRQKAIEANRKREATIREKEDNDRKLAALTDTKSRFLTNIQAGEMSIAVAYAAHQEETRKQREEQRQLAMGWRDTCTQIAESVRYLSGGKKHAQIFLEGFYPHESDYLAPGMQLTRERIDSAIEFLQHVREGVTK